MENLCFEFLKVYGLEYLEKKEYQEKVEKIVRLEAPKASLGWKGPFVWITCQAEERKAIVDTLWMFYRVKPRVDLVETPGE